MQAFATFACTLILFVTLGRFQEIFPFLAPLQLGKLSIAIGLGVVLATNARDLTLLLGKSPIKNYLLIMTALSTIGVAFSVYPGDALEKCMGFLRLLLTVSIIVALSINTLQSMIISICSVVLLISIQMLLSTSTRRIAVSETYDPNDIALLCNTFLPFCLVLISHRNFIIKMLGLAASGGAIGSIALTGSRGGFIALAAMSLYTIMLVKKGRILLIVLMGLGAAIFMALAGDVLWDRLQNLIDGTDYNLDSGGGRIEIWKAAIDMILQRPIFGVGIGQFTTGLATLTNAPWKTAHNTFLQVGGELGVGGLYAFCAILFFIFRLSVRGSQADFLSPLEKNFYLCLRLSLLGYCIGAFFLSHAYTPITYTFFCLAVIMYYHIEKKESMAKQHMPQRPYTENIDPEPPQNVHILHPTPIVLQPSPKNLSAQQQTQLDKAEMQRQLKKSRLEAGDKRIKTKHNDPT